MFHASAVILSGNAASAILLLARNLILARMIPVDDYGVAATFVLALAAVEMVTALGLQQQIVQSRQGDDPHYQNALQGFQLLRGVAAGLVLFVLAAPVAQFLGTTEAVYAYQMLALVPVLNALQHFDIHRLNRQDRFGPLILTTTLPSALSLVAIVPLAWWFGDWRAMLWATIGQLVLSVVLSHLLAERAFRPRLDRGVMAASLRFGWPLLANALLMFIVFQGDRLTVGHHLGMTDLAIFAMGVTLTLTPGLVITKSGQTLLLPRLSASEGPEFDRLVSLCMNLHLLFGVLLAAGAALFGPFAVHVLLGPNYAALAMLIAPLAAIQAVRMVKVAPAIVALSRARSHVSLWGNVPRALSFGVAWWLLDQGHGLHSVILCALIGEALGAPLSLWMMRRTTARGVGRDEAAAFALLALALVPALAPLWETGSAAWGLTAVAAGCLGLGLIRLAALLKTLRALPHRKDASSPAGTGDGGGLAE
jgi:O-antigen/teichoic acid export membrane protein